MAFENSHIDGKLRKKGPTLFAVVKSWAFESSYRHLSRGDGDKNKPHEKVLCGNVLWRRPLNNFVWVSVCETTRVGLW